MAQNSQTQNLDQAENGSYEASKEAYVKGVDEFIDFIDESKEMAPEANKAGFEKLAADMQKHKEIFLAGGVRQYEAKKQERIDNLTRILENGPTKPEDTVELVEGLSYEEVRRQHLIEKYGKDYFARCRAFFAGELDSHLISGINTKQDWAERSKAGEVARKGIISVFNRQNAPAAAVAIAIGVLTGGLGAPAAGVLMGGSFGRFSAELFASRHEGNARLSMLEAEREHWLKLKELAAAYRAETDPEAQKIKFQTFLDEYYLVNETSASRQKFQSAENNFIEVSKRWGGIKNICQSLGGVAGLGGGLLWGHVIGYFSGIKGGLTVLKGQKVFHGVERINGIWNFIGKAGEMVGNQTVPSGQIAYHVMNAANPVAAEVAARIYAAATIKALPTLGALCVAGLRHLKTKNYGQEVENQFTYFNQSWQTSRDNYLNRQRQPNEGGVSVLAQRESGIQATEESSQAPEGLDLIKKRKREGALTRNEILDNGEINPENKNRLSREAAQMVFAWIEKYNLLNPKRKLTAEERDKIFEEHFLRLLESRIAVHGTTIEENGEEKTLTHSDLDGEMAIELFRLAGADLNYKRIKYLEQGKYEEDKLTLDSGNGHGFVVKGKDKDHPFGRTFLMDHHGEESGDDLSTTEIVYRVLVSFGFPRKERIEKLVEFVNNVDNMTGVFRDPQAILNSPRTLVGLSPLFRANEIAELMVKKGKNPTDEITEDDVKDYRRKRDVIDEKTGEKTGKKEIIPLWPILVERSKELMESDNESRDLLKKMEGEGLIIDTSYGKALIDIEGKINKRIFAASGYAIHIKWYPHDDPKKIRYFISGMPREVSLSEGMRIRSMWLKPTEDRNKETKITLADVVRALAGDNFAPQGRLKEFFA